MNQLKSEDVIELPISQVDAAVQVFIRAFEHYPLFPSLFSEPRERTQVESTFFQFVIKYGIKYGKVWAASKELESLLVLISPQNNTLPFSKMLQADVVNFIFRLGITGIFSFYKISNYYAELQKEYAPEPHWYLIAAATEPFLQGRGYFSRILRPVLQELAMANLPVYLETHDYSDVPLYEHFGFKTVAVHSTPICNLDLYCMKKW